MAYVGVVCLSKKRSLGFGLQVGAVAQSTGPVLGQRCFSMSTTLNEAAMALHRWRVSQIQQLRTQESDGTETSFLVPLPQSCRRNNADGLVTGMGPWHFIEPVSICWTRTRVGQIQRLERSISFNKVAGCVGLL